MAFQHAILLLVASLLFAGTVQAAVPYGETLYEGCEVFEPKVVVRIGPVEEAEFESLIWDDEVFSAFIFRIATGGHWDERYGEEFVPVFIPFQHGLRSGYLDESLYGPYRGEIEPYRARFLERGFAEMSLLYKGMLGAMRTDVAARRGAPAKQDSLMILKGSRSSKEGEVIRCEQDVFPKQRELKYRAADLWSFLATDGYRHLYSRVEPAELKSCRRLGQKTLKSRALDLRHPDLVSMKTSSEIVLLEEMILFLREVGANASYQDAVTRSNSDLHPSSDVTIFAYRCEGS